MAKFYGEVGYATQTETSPGVWREQIVNRYYSGDILRNTSRMREAQVLNDNLTLDNRISILADPYAYEQFHSIRYVKWLSALWKVTGVEVQRPRLILTIGGVYNESSTSP